MGVSVCGGEEGGQGGSYASVCEGWGCTCMCVHAPAIEKTQASKNIKR